MRNQHRTTTSGSINNYNTPGHCFVQRLDGRGVIPPWRIKIVMTCLRIIIRNESQTVSNSPLRSSGPMLNPTPGIILILVYKTFPIGFIPPNTDVTSKHDGTLFLRPGSSLNTPLRSFLYLMKREE